MGNYIYLQNALKKFLLPAVVLELPKFFHILQLTLSSHFLMTSKKILSISNVSDCVAEQPFEQHGLDVLKETFR